MKATCVDYIPELASGVVYYTNSYSGQDYCAEGNSYRKLVHYG